MFTIQTLNSPDLTVSKRSCDWLKAKQSKIIQMNKHNQNHHSYHHRHQNDDDHNNDNGGERKRDRGRDDVTHFG